MSTLAGTSLNEINVLDARKVKKFNKCLFEKFIYNSNQLIYFLNMFFQIQIAKN